MRFGRLIPKNQSVRSEKMDTIGRAYSSYFLEGAQGGGLKSLRIFGASLQAIAPLGLTSLVEGARDRHERLRD